MEELRGASAVSGGLMLGDGDEVSTRTSNIHFNNTDASVHIHHDSLY